MRVTVAPPPQGACDIATLPAHTITRTYTTHSHTHTHTHAHMRVGRRDRAHVRRERKQFELRGSTARGRGSSLACPRAQQCCRTPHPSTPYTHPGGVQDIDVNQFDIDPMREVVRVRHFPCCRDHRHDVPLALASHASCVGFTCIMT